MAGETRRFTDETGQEWVAVEQSSFGVGARLPGEPLPQVTTASTVFHCVVTGEYRRGLTPDGHLNKASIEMIRSWLARAEVEKPPRS